MVTKQYAFDHLMDRILNNKPLAWDPDFVMVPSNTGACIYSKKVNGGCAIGAHIPDELYTKAIEGLDWDALKHRYPMITMVFEDYSSPFWEHLQAIHDGLADTNFPLELSSNIIEYRLKEIGKYF